MIKYIDSMPLWTHMDVFMIYINKLYTISQKLKIEQKIMEVVTKYDTQLEKWELKDIMKFKGSNTESLNHEFGISPQDPNEPDCCYFNVAVEKTIENVDNGIVFSAKTSNCYKVRNNNKTPTIEFCFDLIDDGTFEFAKIFNEKKKNTYVFDKKVPIPKIEEFRKEIQKSIDFWVRNIRDTGLN